MNKRLLIVDDDETILFAFRRYFESFGHSVTCARELEEAEALAACCNYDLAIIDLSLSGQSSTDGLEIIRFARRHCPQARLIVLTAHAAAHIEQEALRRGAHAFLRKPQALEDVREIAEQLMAGVA